MKHKRSGNHLWNRTLALLMSVFVSVQLAVPAYAEMDTKPAAKDAAPAEDAPALAVEAEKASDSLNIPGYTRVTDANLEVGKYYLIVSQDSNGKLYALYPDESGKTTPSGNAIKAAGTLVADLTINGENVTAQWEKDHTALEMSQLHFVVEKRDDKCAFKGANGIYLSLTDQMLADAPSYLSTGVNDGKYTIENSGRILDFNKAGDPKQFGNFNTNFWGPRDSRFPIYLYTKDCAEAPVLSTGELRNAIRNAQDMLTTVDEESRTALEAAINSANKLLEAGNITQELVDQELAKLVAVMKSVNPNPDSIAPGAPKPGTTQGQPFGPGAGDSANFRIPAIITLKHQKNDKLNGRVLAAIDARWNHTADASGLDTLVSYSDDNGANWNYNYANFFNDSVNSFMHGATAFIDPELVEGKDGTIYLMVDLFPGGVALNNAPRQPKAATGYQEVNGTQRLVLYTNVEGQTVDNWEYYVGDFKDGFAPVIARNGNDDQAAYYVDDHYYLYNSNKVELYCQQMGSNQFVKQNVFFYNADLNVMDASYLWVVSSKDGGANWGAPMILNPQVRPLDGASKFYGVGPGAGLCTQDGTIMLTTYTHPTEKCSFIYSEDGVNWRRSETVENPGTYSSESCLVEIDANTVRQFYRDGHETLYYTDHTKDENGEWRVGHPVNTGVKKTHRNQLSAINYSETLYGKPVIMVSTATDGGGRRNDGKIYTFVVENDKSMTLVNTHDVNNGSYAYSSLTELENGSVALLYEGNGIQYTVIDKKNILPDENYKHVDLALSCGETLTLPGNTKDAVVNSNPEVVEATKGMVEKKIPVYNSAQGNTGTNSTFTGKLVSLTDALFRFNKTDSDGHRYQITATTTDGDQVWVSTTTANSNHSPVSIGAESVTMEDAGNGDFYLHCKDGYLYFYRNPAQTDKFASFDRYNTTNDACKFNLYRPATKDEESPDIAGYVKIKSLEQIKDGDFYLITATVNGATYILNPSTNTGDKYSHILKLNAQADLVAEDSVSYFEPEFTITAKTAGKADVQVDATIYHVTVSHNLVNDWKHDKNGHWHECSGCSVKVDEAAHSYVDEATKEPTCTEAGVMTHKCSVCSYSWEEELPVKKHTLVYTPEVPATSESAGILEHWRCTECGSLFIYEDASFEVTANELVISKVVGGKPVVEQPVVDPALPQNQKNAIQNAHNALKAPNGVKESGLDKLISVSINNNTADVTVSGVKDQATGKNKAIIDAETIDQVIVDHNLDDAHDICFVAESFLKIRVVNAKVASKNDSSVVTSSVTYDIAPYANVILSTDLGDALIDTLPMAVNDDAVAITLTLPDTFEVNAGEKIIVVHEKQDGTKYYYDVVREGNQITFETTHGFSEFTVMTVPMDPDKPITPDKPADSSNPQTGDTNHVFPWVSIAVVSIVCLAVIALHGKKKYHI